MLVELCFLVLTHGQAVATAQLDVHERGLQGPGGAGVGGRATTESRVRRLGSIVSRGA